MTGDSSGEFWTASILGTFNLSQKVRTNDGSAQIDPEKNIRTVLERYKHDKYSSRNLVFLLQLSRMCDSISERFEDILDELEHNIHVKVKWPLSVPASANLSGA
jgi:hypothetical protein